MSKTKVLILASYPVDGEDGIQRYSDTKTNQLGWQDVEFDLAPQEGKDYDAVLALNHPKQGQEYRISYREGQRFALAQEPGENICVHPFMFMNSHFQQYKAFFTLANGQNRHSGNLVKSPPYLGWYFSKLSYLDLCNLPTPVKNHKISCLASTLSWLAGHQKRLAFVNHLKHLNLGIDFFGKGHNFVEDKWDALAPYQYSISIENSTKEEYFTEKIQDCFLAYTVPLYYGCKNIHRYFPEKSLIHLNIDNYDEALKTLTETIENDDYKERLSAVEEARDLVLNKYHPFAFVKDAIVPRIDFSAIPKVHRVQYFDNTNLNILLYMFADVSNWGSHLVLLLSKTFKKLSRVMRRIT